MKAKIVTAIIGASLLLTACGGDHAHPKAVEKLEEAQANALAKAPKAEEVKFDDHGQPPMGGVGGTSGAKAAEPAETATEEPAATATAEVAKTDATETANTATAAAENDAKTEETPKTEPQTETEASGDAEKK